MNFLAHRRRGVFADSSRRPPGPRHERAVAKFAGTKKAGGCQVLTAGRKSRLRRSRAARSRIVFEITCVITLTWNRVHDHRRRDVS